MSFSPVPEADEAIAAAVVDSGFHVHQSLGPGLLESVYEVCLCHKLAKRKIAYAQQVKTPIIYDGRRIATDLVVDLLIEDRIVVELKAVEKLLPIHEAQLLTYLKLTDKRVGFLMNFNSVLFKDGIKRMVL